MKTLSVTLLTCISIIIVQSALGSDVRNFGAAGDGVADDSNAIQRAVLESTDGLIVFPRGNFRITTTITVDLAKTGRISLSGNNGVGTVVMAGPGPAFRFVGTHGKTAEPADFNPLVWERERMPHVDGLEIVGGHEAADGIEFQQVMQPTLRGVLIREVRDGVRFVTRNRNVLIDACHIYNNRGAGVLFERVNLHQAIIQGSHISYNKRGGIKVVGGEIRNFQITGNDIEYNYDLTAQESADVWFDLREGSMAEGTITGNTIQAQPSPGGANIRFLGPERPENRTQLGLWSITGNLIGNQEVNIHLNQCRGMAVTGNHVYTGKERTLLLERCHHLVIGQNSLDQSHNDRGGFTNGITVRDCDGISLNGLILDRAASGSAKMGGAIEILDSRETTITGCQIFEPKFRGLYIGNSRNTRVSDNLVIERLPADQREMEAAMEVGPGSRNTIISGNLVGKGRKGDIVAETGTATLKDNYPAAE